MTPRPSSIAQALRLAQERGLERIDAQLLLLHSVRRDIHDRAWLIAHEDEELSSEDFDAYQRLVKRRLDDEPLAYITGIKEFFGLRLKVDQRVLVPRPDTETLVEWVLELWPVHAERNHILDAGTGSGAIALAVKHQCPEAWVTASDASEDALLMAADNSLALGLPIHLVKADWLEGMSEFSIIASNPPYIELGDPHLNRLRHEPASALSSGSDGLDAIRSLVRQAPGALLPGGWLLLEHGHLQAPAVRHLLTAQGFVNVQSRKDLAGIERCSGGQWMRVK